MNNDSMPPFDTTFHHLAYVARWSPSYFIFKTQKVVGDTLPYKQGDLLIQLFTTLLMWQGGPLSYFIFKTQKVIGDLAI
jgi:hypothetical protein